MKNDYRLPAKLNRKIGQAMHDYSMFSEGDHVLVAVSGGVDSLALIGILALWQKKAPIQFTLAPYHIDHGFWRSEKGTASPEKTIGCQLQPFALSLAIIQERVIRDQSRTCFLCARNRRNQLFDIAQTAGCNKIALGHHQDDLIETLFLNAIYSGNISTMVPRQDLFGGILSLVRPMAYLEKHEVQQIAAELGFTPVKNLCPLSADTRREKVRELLEFLYQKEPGAKKSLFASLANVRQDYLL